MVKRRNRGVLLDRTIVRSYAKRIGLSGFNKFEQHVFNTNLHYGPNCKAAYNAWYGSARMEKKFADDIARSLRLESHDSLVLADSHTSAWKQLIRNENYQESFLTFYDHTKTDLFLANFNIEENEELEQVPLKAPWHLELSGNKGEFVFIILQSESTFFQLAPVELDGYGNEFTTQHLRYPNRLNFNFDHSYGLGWRRIIAIKSKCLPRDTSDRDVNFSCIIDDLNIFASRLTEIKNNKISVDKHEFEIVNQE